MDITYAHASEESLDRPFEGMTIAETSNRKVTITLTYEGDAGFAVTVETASRLRRRRIIRRTRTGALATYQRTLYQHHLAASPNLWDPMPEADAAPRVLDKSLARREWRRFGRC